MDSLAGGGRSARWGAIGKDPKSIDSGADLGSRPARREIPAWAPPQGGGPIDCYLPGEEEYYESWQALCW